MPIIGNVIDPEQAPGIVLPLELLQLLPISQETRRWQINDRKRAQIGVEIGKAENCRVARGELDKRLYLCYNRSVVVVMA